MLMKELEKEEVNRECVDVKEGQRTMSNLRGSKTESRASKHQKLKRWSVL